MVEHTIQYDMYSLFMTAADQFFKILIVSQSLIDSAIVRGIIAMRSGREARPQIQRRKAALLHVSYPCL